MPAPKFDRWFAESPRKAPARGRCHFRSLPAYGIIVELNLLLPMSSKLGAEHVEKQCDFKTGTWSVFTLGGSLDLGHARARYDYERELLSSADTVCPAD